MKQQEVFRKIGTILSELNNQYEYLDNTDNQQNDLELELFVANAHFLVEHSEVLRKLNFQNITAPAIPTAIVTELTVKKQEEKYFEPVVQQVAPVSEIKPEPEAPAKPVEIETPQSTDKPVPHIDLAANGADDDFSYKREELEVIKHELVLDESEIWDDDDDKGFDIDEINEPREEVRYTPPVQATKPEPVKEIPQVEKVPAKAMPSPELKKEIPAVEKQKEIIIEETLTINQMISAQLSKSDSKVTEQVHLQPIADLKQAITLNDKLLYIRDLFNGYNLAYSEALDILNRFAAFEEADDFLKKNYAIKNHWDTKQATADKFYELLRRRYA